ncbi:hypothetical protein QZM18_19215 [Burkholderia diffusa]|uniref:hypothetical protein n=1 Tax=Burkholderia diffusa TaxID=488732 RepID=UPI00264C6360|nr:hypothetical protein [Burkholderia diffusa]MDN7906229.1 hypothetical protein [Burkholderia diffusa]
MADFERDQSKLLDEITIVIRPHNLHFCEYIGTRLQLEAEGIIPSGTKWPDGFREIRWRANDLYFSLRRERPEGVKGPRRSFFDCDNWRLRIEPENRSESERAYLIAEKAKELHDLIRIGSNEWRTELYKSHGTFVAAKNDRGFQAFKALIPALAPSCNGGRIDDADRTIQSSEVHRG